MSTETIAVIVSSLTLTVTLVGSILGLGAWPLNRLDTRSDTVDKRFDTVESNLRTEISLVAAKVGDVAVAVARWEGPRPDIRIARR